MTSTGIVRRIDGWAYRAAQGTKSHTGLNDRDPLEIYSMEGNTIILKKYEPACIFCNSTKEVINYRGRNICKACIDRLKKDIDY